MKRPTFTDGLNIFYREAGPKDAPVVLLLHGFPSSSHMFRNLIPQLADAYHVIAPDYPAFGHSDTTAQVIHRFRELGTPVREVGDVVATTDAEARAALIAQYLERLENQLDQQKAAVSSLRRLLQPDPPPMEVELRRVEATTVAAVVGTVDLGEVLAWYGEAIG
jgi:pimeloyl-ACP methyl ester carboxylesterase